MKLICPICGKELNTVERQFVCPGNHSFDIARQGHVNLLPVQQKHSKYPGDTKEQVISRRAFLDGGFYEPIARTLVDTALELGAKGPILDVGCGEGYYSSRLARAMAAELVGLDISKEAVRCAAGRYKNALWLCATASHLPIKDASAGIVTSLFALTMPEEFHRVLRPDGAFIQVLAGEEHLLGLKSIIYPELTRKPKQTTPEVSGFVLIRSEKVEFTFTVEEEQVQNLFSMTPHVYRISKAGADRLAATEKLTDKASCVINLYRPL